MVVVGDPPGRLRRPRHFLDSIHGRRLAFASPSYHRWPLLAVEGGFFPLDGCFLIAATLWVGGWSGWRKVRAVEGWCRGVGCAYDGGGNCGSRGSHGIGGGRAEAGRVFSLSSMVFRWPTTVKSRWKAGRRARCRKLGQLLAMRSWARFFLITSLMMYIYIT
jgi:hypothetical protein